MPRGKKQAVTSDALEKLLTALFKFADKVRWSVEDKKYYSRGTGCVSRTMRLLVKSRCGVLALALGCMLKPAQGHADMPVPLLAQFELIWSTPITTEMTPQNTFGPSKGLALRAVAVGPYGQDRPVAFLASLLGGQRPGSMLLLDAEKAGLDAAIPLALPESNLPRRQLPGSWFFQKQRPNLNPVVIGLALGTDGGMWLGGFSGVFMDASSDTHRDAYLAKLDVAGKVVWTRTYGEGGSLSIESIAPDAMGGAVGVGRSRGRMSWLAKVGPDGKLLLEHRFGNDKGVVVVPLPEGRFLVTGYMGEGQGATYQDVLSTWVLDETGALHGPTRVREGLNRYTGSYFGKVAASAVADGAYVTSNWSDDFRPQAVEVARVGPDGVPLWHQMLPSTIRNTEARTTTYATCNPALATLSDGDALVACAMDGEIQLYRLARLTGAQRAARLPLPECHGSGRRAALFLMARTDGAVLLAGSRPGNSVAGSCSWIGRVVMPAG